MRPIFVLLAFTAALAAQSFEVASIKPAPPQDMNNMSVGRHTDKSGLRASNVSLMDMTTDAYRVQPRQVSGPEWLDSVRFDIVAKLPARGKEEQIPEMLQSLLKDRFGLKLRDETKELPIYALTVSKAGSKMKPTEDSGGMSTNNSNGHIHVDAKTTMDNFARHLSQRMDRPVVNQTGLDGNYQFQVDWLSDTVTNPPADAPPSVFTALQDQLGLKLAPTKGPVLLLVVEHIERSPSDN